MASAKAKVAGAGAILRPVSSGTQVIFVLVSSLQFVCFNMDWLMGAIMSVLYACSATCIK